MSLVKRKIAYSSSLTVAGRLTLEALFFGVILPLALVYAIVGATWGLITLASRIVGASAQFAYGPWKDIASVLSLVRRHCRYIYRFDFLPWRKKRLEEKRARAMARLESARLQPTRHERSRALVLDSDYDSIDVTMFWALAIQFLPYAIWIPQLIVSTIGFISVWSYMPHYQGVVMHAPPAPAATVVYQMQPADEQEADFGPWNNRAQVIDRVKTPGFRQIALLSDSGSAKYARHKVGLVDGFAAASTEKVSNARLLNGQIAFEDEHNNTFAVNPDQVFLLEGDTSTAFVFTSDAQLKTIPLKQLHTKEN